MQETANQLNGSDLVMWFDYKGQKGYRFL